MAGLLLLIIFIAYVYNTNKKVENLEKENLLLKKEIKALKENNLNTNSKNDVINKIIDTGVSNTKIEEKTLTEEEKQKLKLKKKIEEQERKNTSILITGAILIVLAAIVFLTSAWNSIPNLIKTCVIILLVGVFLGASKIAKEKLNLEKTSSTFFYIAMAYIPICLVSCSVFALFGEYLSIYGEGNLVYLTLVMILTSVIYYINYKTKQSTGLMCSSILAQISAVILGTLVFEPSLKLILMNLLIYNIILILLSENRSISKINFIQYTTKAIPYIVAFFILINLSEISMLTLLILIVLDINYLLNYIKNRNRILDGYLFNIIIYMIGLYFTYNFEGLNESFKLVIEMCYVLIVFLIERMIVKIYKDKNIEKSAIIVSILAIGAIYLESFEYVDIFIKPYMIGIVEETFLIFAFIGSRETGKKILSYLIPSCFILIGYNLLSELDATYHYYIIFSIITFIIGEIITNEKIRKGFFVISNIWIIATYIVALAFDSKEFSNDVIYFMMLFAIYIYSYFKYPNYKFFKYISYIVGTVCLNSIAEFLELDGEAQVLVPLIPTVVITMLEYKNNKKITLDTIFSAIFLWMTMDFVEHKIMNEDIINEILCLIWVVAHIYIFTSQKSIDIFKGIAYICCLELYNTLMVELQLTTYTAFSMIGLTIFAIVCSKTILKKYIKEIDIVEYISFSIIYLMALSMYIDEKDGMIFVFALVCLVAYSYMKKYGAIFIVTTLAIIVNSLALTREFWFSIPWWMYLLVIGVILIAFAMKNESDNNKEKLTIGMLLKKVKDNVEK